MINFANIAIALSGPRGSGRTHKMIVFAPNGATVICANQQHKQDIEHIAKQHGRPDLNFMEIYDDFLGLQDVFVIDHYTIECLLNEASLIQNDYERQLYQMIEKNHQLEMSYCQLLERNKELTLTVDMYSRKGIK